VEKPPESQDAVMRIRQKTFEEMLDFGRLETAVIPCSLDSESKDRILKYAEELKAAAPHIGSHGFSEEEFWNSGIFQSAIERLRGSQAATTVVKRKFIDDVLTCLKQSGSIIDYSFTGAGDRHDYQIKMPSGRQVMFEAKGCLDGNNTNIFQRPPGADEFFIWSLCQNAGADPRRNAWSGIHTRLGPTIVAEGQRVDALVIWDMLCGTVARPCPKLSNPERTIVLPSGAKTPPPCIYLFPRSKPDPRNNPKPAAWKLEELSFIEALAKTFGCLKSEIIELQIETRMEGSDLQRRSSLIQDGQILIESKWTTLKRASR
jgi:hypothetical protein